MTGIPHTFDDLPWTGPDVEATLIDSALPNFDWPALRLATELLAGRQQKDGLGNRLPVGGD